MILVADTQRIVPLNIICEWIGHSEYSHIFNIHRYGYDDSPAAYPYRRESDDSYQSGYSDGADSGFYSINSPVPFYDSDGVIDPQVLQEFASRSELVASPQVVPAAILWLTFIQCEWDGCEFIFDSKPTVPQIRKHFNERHSEVMQKDYASRCLWHQCSRREPLKANSIAKHVGNTHLGAGKTNCTVCDVTLSTKDAQKRHKLTNCQGIKATV